MVPKVSKWGFWGGICIEKWSLNFDSGTRSATFGTPKKAKNTHFGHFGGYPPPPTPLTENHFAKKTLAERGGTPPPLTEKIR